MRAGQDREPAVGQGPGQSQAVFDAHHAPVGGDHQRRRLDLREPVHLEVGFSGEHVDQLVVDDVEVGGTVG